MTVIVLAPHVPDSVTTNSRPAAVGRSAAAVGGRVEVRGVKGAVGGGRVSRSTSVLLLEYKAPIKPCGTTTVPENELWTPKGLVIVRFPSRKNAEDFLASEEYAPVKAIRHKHAETTVAIVDDF